MATVAAIKVVLADSDALAVAHVSHLLAAIGGTVIPAQTVDDLRKVLSMETPDLLVTEMQLGANDMLPVIRELCAAGGAPPILVLSTEDSEPRVLAAIAAGASGYWLKQHALSDLPSLILLCAAGHKVLDGQLIGTVMRGYQELARPDLHSKPSVPDSGLSSRAMQVLELMALGLRNREIAARLGVSEHTVKVYVAQLFAHLNASDRTAAVLRAVERGLVRVGQGTDGPARLQRRGNKESPDPVQAAPHS